jgi:hypothetical protein
VEGTGLARLCGICLRTANRDGTVDIFKTSHKLAKCDQNLINNIDYYLLAHFVIYENCFKNDTNFNCDPFRAGTPILFSEEQIRKNFNYVQETQWLDTIKYETGNNSGNTIILKFGIIKFHLSYVLVSREQNLIAPYSLDYDDASVSLGIVTIDGFRSPGKFTITKEPTPDTLFQFWNFVANKNISVIISVLLNRTWPDRNILQITLSKIINLVHRDTKIFDSYDWITVQITIGDKIVLRCYSIKYVLINFNFQKTIEIIIMKKWSSEATYPENVLDFVNFCNETNTILKKSNSVLVMSQ